MSVLVVLWILLAPLALVGPVMAQTPTPGATTEAEALRRELDQMRQQFESVRQQYQQAIEAMSQRLQRLEARPQTAATQPVVAQVPPAPAQPSALDYLRPREPFSLSARTGGGQLLFDIGVAADFIAAFTSGRVDRADAGTFAGRENRFFPREIELSLFGQIDPYARGEVRIEAAEEFEDGERELHVGLAEAHLTLLTLPFGTQAKLGLMRTRFGLLNQRHAHDLPQPDRPNVLVRFFGEEGLVESGGELTWVPAFLPFYLEGLVGVFNGDNDEAFGHGSLRNPLVTGRVRTFFEFLETSALQLGASIGHGRTGDDEDQTLLGLDAKYKLTPEAWRHPLLTLAGEAIWSWRDVPDGGDRNRFGAYAYAEVQPWRRLAAGVRYDWTEYLEERGSEWAVEPYLAFLPSEFLRFRLAYKRTERTNRSLFTAGNDDARRAHELFLQATFILGAHPAHAF
jgi:hypothetical protein